MQGRVGETFFWEEQHLASPNKNEGDNGNKTRMVSDVSRISIYYFQTISDFQAGSPGDRFRCAVRYISRIRQFRLRKKPKKTNSVGWMQCEVSLSLLSLKQQPFNFIDTVDGQNPAPPRMMIIDYSIICRV